MRLGLATVVVGVGLLSLAGCQEDNNKSANINSIPGGGTQAAPKNQREFMEQQKGLNPYGADYPGSKGGPPAK